MAVNQVSKEKTSLFKRLFRIGITKQNQEVVPTKNVKTKDGLYDTVREKFPPQVQSILKYWTTNCHDDQESFANRKEMYKDLEMIFYNSALLSRAMTLYADEAVQADTNAQIIGVEAEDPNQRDFILDFISNSGIEKYLRSTALNIVQYGDAGWVLSMDENGVESVLPVKPEDIRSRIEFTPHEVQKKMRSSDEYFGKILGKSEVLRHLATTLSDTTEDYATYFKSYLFGFEVGEFVLPPWKFLHFRNFTTKSPFYPFGLPQFIHSIAPYRQYDAAMTLQAIARGAKFPIDLYKLGLTNQMSPTDKLDKALEFIREFDNSGLRETKKEGLAVGERIITIKDLFEYEQIIPNIDLGDIGDIELLENQLILSTGLPRNMLDPNNGAFGNSGIALIQQYVPFKRQIFHIQSILLEQVTQLVKIHLVQSGKFALKDINFKLSMPYPESQADRDAIGTQSDLITLANSILDSLQAKLLPDGQPLTKDLVTAVYSKVLPFKPDDINKWVDLTMASKSVDTNPNPEQAPPEEPGAEPAIGGGGAPAGSPPEATGSPETAPEEAPAPEADLNAALEQELGTAQESTTRKGKLKMMGKISLEEAVSREIFLQTQNKSKFREGVFNNRHFYSSKIRSHDFDLNLLIESKKQKMRLDEEKAKKTGRSDESILNFGGE